MRKLDLTCDLATVAYLSLSVLLFWRGTRARRNLNVIQRQLHCEDYKQHDHVCLISLFTETLYAKKICLPIRNTIITRSIASHKWLTRIIFWTLPGMSMSFLWHGLEIDVLNFISTSISNPWAEVLKPYITLVGTKKSIRIVCFQSSKQAVIPEVCLLSNWIVMKVEN